MNEHQRLFEVLGVEARMNFILEQRSELNYMKQTLTE